MRRENRHQHRRILRIDVMFLSAATPINRRSIVVSSLWIFKITVEASPKADGTVGGGGAFAEGSSNTVTATPNTGHTFVHWVENGRVVSTSENYTFTLDGNVTLVADFR
jgi:hypothetical protein